MRGIMKKGDTVATGQRVGATSVDLSCQNIPVGLTSPFDIGLYNGISMTDKRV